MNNVARVRIPLSPPQKRHPLWVPFLWRGKIIGGLRFCVSKNYDRDAIDDSFRSDALSRRKRCFLLMGEALRSESRAVSRKQR